MTGVQTCALPICLGPGGLLLIRFSVSSLVMLGHIVLSWNRSSGRGRNAPLFGKELYDTPPHARTGILSLGVTFTHARPPAPRRGPFTTACPRNLREFQKYSQNMTGFLKIWKASATAGKREATLTRQVSSQRGRTVLVEPRRIELRSILNRPRGSTSLVGDRASERIGSPTNVAAPSRFNLSRGHTDYVPRGIPLK